MEVPNPVRAAPKTLMDSLGVIGSAQLVASLDPTMVGSIAVLLTGFGLAGKEFLKRCREKCGDPDKAEADFTTDEVFDLFDELASDLDFIKKQTLVDQAAFAIAVENLDGVDKGEAAKLDQDQPERAHRMFFEWLRGQFAEAEDDRAGLIAVQRQVETNLVWRLKNLQGEVRQVLDDTSEKLQSAWTDALAPLHARLDEILGLLKRDRPPVNPARPRNLPAPMPPDRFIGRELELLELFDTMAAAPALDKAGDGIEALAITQPQTIRGTGGIGKTTLARQIAWLLYLSGKIDAAFEITADSPEALDTNLANLADFEGIRDPDQPAPAEVDARLALVLGWLRQNAGKWLLILDNVDASDARQAVYDRLGDLAGGRVLVTSRLDDWSAGKVETRRLEAFTPSEALRFLQSRHRDWAPAGAESEPDAVNAFKEIAAALDHNTLALAISAAYLRHHRKSPETFLEILETKLEKVLEFQHENIDHSLALEALWDATVEQLSPPASRLLELLAFLAPKPFPADLLEKPGAGEAGDFLGGGEPECWDADEALADLRAHGLLVEDESGVHLLRLIQTVTRHRLARKNGTETPLVAALDLLNEHLPSPDFDVDGWRLWEVLDPHLTAVIEQEEKLSADSTDGSPFPRMGRLLNEFARWLKLRADHVRAEPLYRRALTIDEASFGPDHPNVATDLNNLALLLQDTNRLEEAEPLMKRALTIDEASFGPDHPEVATDLNNLALLLQATDRREDAEPLMRRALKIDEANFGPNHPNVAIRLNNLAALLKVTNRLEDAEPLMQRALAIFEKSLGDEHPSVAVQLNNLALLLQATDRREEAEQLMKRALNIDEASFGPDHPNVAIRLNNLAALLRLEDAEPLMRRMVGIFLTFLARTGHPHPNLIAALRNYGGICAEMEVRPEEFFGRLAKLGAEAGVPLEAMKDLIAQTFGGGESDESTEESGPTQQG